MVKHDTGRYGEYLTYKCLKTFETNGAKFLFNLYVPTEAGQTSEIDVLMIHSKGLFVIESKNYSGWIFGNEAQKNWYQTLPTGKGRSRKEPFYNPIIQNRTHIKHLKTFLGAHVPMNSIIVFSDRCTLKSIQITSCDVKVINRAHVAAVVSSICNQVPNDLLTENAIANLYNLLYPYSQVDAATKAQHISNICSKPNSQTLTPCAPITSIAPSEPIELSAPNQSQTEVIQL